MKLDRCYSRPLFSLVLVIVTIGLVSLGIRLPSLTGVSSSSKPKPRPRAIIQTQIKTCKEKLATADASALVTRIFSFITLAISETTEYCSIPSSPPAEISSLQSSRAPPRFS